MSQEKEKQGHDLPQQEPVPQQGTPPQPETAPQPEPTLKWEPASQGEPAPRAEIDPETGKLPAGKGKKPPKYTGKAKAAYIGYVTLTVISAIIVALYIGFAVLSPQKVTVDGETVDCEKYNIDGSNFFLLWQLGPFWALSWTMTNPPIRPLSTACRNR